MPSKREQEITRADIFREVAKNLRDFGYPDATAAIVAAVYDTMLTGQPIPHGIVGRFAQGQLAEILPTLAELPAGELTGL